MAELGTGEAAEKRANKLIDEVDYGREVEDTPVEEVWDGLLEELEGEAGKIVAFEEGAGIEGTAGDVGDIQAGEAVDRAGVSPELEGVGVLEHK